MTISANASQAIFGVAMRHRSSVEAAEVQHRDLEEDDPEDQHVDAVGREHHVEGVGLQPVHGRPAREHDADGQQAADQQPDDADEGVGLHQPFGLVLELQARSAGRSGRWWLTLIVSPHLT
jgi:hypothetical protein